jgi:hypothetical protein
MDQEERRMNKRENFAVVMTMLAETYGRPVTDAMLDGYWLTLEELDEGDLKSAARKALTTSRFMPTPSELLAFARPRRTREQRSSRHGRRSARRSTSTITS